MFGSVLLKGADNAEKQLDSIDRKGLNVGETLGKIGKVALTVGAALVTGFGAATAGAFKLAEKASNLSEAQNVIKETFKESSKSVLDWTKTVQNTAGISEKTASGLVGIGGAMLKGAGLTEQAAGNMSKSMVQLSGDLTSFFNVEGGAEQAFQDLKSIITGSSEPMEKYGIDLRAAALDQYALSQGLTKSYTEMTNAEQIQLRYNYVLEKTKDAQGDFGRTLETSFPNQLRVTQMQMESTATSIGQKFLPAFLGIFQAINDGFKTGDWASVGQSIADGLNDVIGQVSGMITEAAPMVATLIGGIATAITEAIPSILPTIIDTSLQILNTLINVLNDNSYQLIEAGMEALTMLILGIADALPQLIDTSLTIILQLINHLSNNLPMIMKAGIEILFAIIDGILDKLPDFIFLAIDLITVFAKGLIDALPKLVEKLPQIIMTIVTVLIDNLPLLIDATIEIITALITTFYENLPLFIKTSVEIILALAAGIVGAIPQLLMVVPKLFDAIGKALAGINWGELGMNILNGIVEGVKNAAKNLANAVVNAAKNALDAAKNLLGIHSPSSVMRDQVGKMIGFGMAEGVTDSMDEIDAAMEKLNLRITGDQNNIQKPVSNTSSMPVNTHLVGQSSDNPSIIINVNYPSLLNMQAIGDLGEQLVEIIRMKTGLRTV